MNKQNTNLPKWFKGSCYDKGGKVTNPFSGQEYELNNTELSMYDFIIGSQLDFQKGLDWFRSKNAKAYMVLLD